MKSSAGKLIALGFLSLLVLVGIPLTVFYIRQTQVTTSKATPTSVLSITPAKTNATVNTTFEVGIQLDPGENAVTFVKFKVLFDPSKLQVLEVKPNETSFPLTLDAAKLSSGSASISLGIGPQPLAAIQSPTEVAKILFRPIATTDSTGTPITFDPVQVQILSLKQPQDEVAENVLRSSTPASVIIAAATGPTPTGPAPTSPNPLNSSPRCTGLTVTPGVVGAAPFAITLNATGVDDDGTIERATFNFSDGQSQDVVDGLGSANASATQTHTYTKNGTYSLTVTFTDDENATSASCAQAVQVGEVTTITGTPTPTLSPTPTPTPTFTPTPTDTPIPTATLAPTGDTTTTIGIVGGMLLAIIGTILFFAL